MQRQIRQFVLALAVVFCMGIVGAPVRAAAIPPQDHNQPDYSKNKIYQQGVREGQNDRKHNLDHSKKHHFQKDEDQKAYEAGYQQGHHDDGHH